MSDSAVDPTSELLKEVAGLNIGEESNGNISAHIVQKLESFFAAPDFTGKLQDFVQEHMQQFVFVEEGQEQPLSNYDMYLKYTKMMESLLQDFLHEHDISHDDIAKLCLEEKEDGNGASFCLDYIIASTEYEAFLQLMTDFRNMQEYEFDGDELTGYSCFSWGISGDADEGLNSEVLEDEAK